LLSFAFAYQFEQVRRLKDFDAEFLCRTEVPFVERYHIGASLESSAAASNDSVILAVMTNPKPNDVRAILDGDGTIMDANTN